MEARSRMIDTHLAGRGIRDPRVLEAMATVPRENFLGEDAAAAAYEDRPLPIGAGQTISQPYIVALMAEAAAPGPADRVLEVGAGSGYAAAVLSRICARVIALERIESLARTARLRLSDLGYDNVEVHAADGSLGWPQGAPFDAIVVSAGGPSVPQALKSQLARGGRLVMPVGGGQSQELVRVTRIGEGADPAAFETTALGGVCFVPLIGAQGWEADARR